MENLQRKIAELETENRSLKDKLDMLEKIRNPLAPLPMRQRMAPAPSDENAPASDGTVGFVRNDLCNNGNSHTHCPGEEILTENPKKLLQYLKTVLGYSIKYEGNKIFLRSIYAFCEEDIFEVEIKNSKIILMNTDYMAEWDEQVNLYIKIGKSYAAFFAAVTLDLFNKKTFG